MRKSFFLILCIGCLLRGSTQRIIWDSLYKDIPVGYEVSYLEDVAGRLSIEQISHPDFHQKFKPSQQSVLNFGFTNSVYWLRFELQNPTSDSLLLALDQAFLPMVVLFYKDKNHQWKSDTSGYNIFLGDKKEIDHFQLFPLLHKQQTYYLRLQPYIHAIPIHIVEKSYWQLAAARQKLSYGIYAGILLFAIIINTFLFFALQKDYFLYYSLLVFFYLLTSALVMEGYAVYVFPRVNLMFWYKVVPVLDMPAMLLYCIAFFELKKNHIALYRLALGSALLFTSYLFLLHFLPLLLALALNQLFALIVFGLGIYIGATVGKMGNNLGYYFAVAYSIWFVLVLIEVIYIQTGWPKHLSPLSYVSTAIFIEAMLLAFLQAKRFQWEKKADHLKQFELKTRMAKMEEDFQRELLNAKLSIQEQTFNLISQEIHDNVGQLLSLAKVQVNIIQQQEVKDKQILEELKDNIGQALNDLRNIAKSLSGEHVASFGLYHSVVQQIKRINSIGLKINIALEGKERSLSEQKKLILFRIIQECIQNVIKHAHAAHVAIVFQYWETELVIVVEDDGKGFDPVVAMQNGEGLGLQNIINRAGFIGGQATVKSVYNNGTIIQISIPYD